MGQLNASSALLLSALLVGCSGGTITSDRSPVDGGQAGVGGTPSGQSGTGGSGTGGEATGGPCNHQPGVGGSCMTGSSFAGSGGSPACAGALAQYCEPFVCGNGSRDTCALPPSLGCDPSSVPVEPCDGDDLGGATCASLGYGSGALSCASCRLDVSGCSECFADPRVGGCAAPLQAAIADDLAVAATPTEIGLAWLETDAWGEGASHLARLSSSLAAVEIVDLDLVSAAQDLGGSILVAPLPSGWVAARWLDPEIVFQSVDAGGARARVMVSSVQPADVGLVLVPRPNGGPLLMWHADSRVVVSVISDDGRSATPPVGIANLDRVFGGTSGTFADGAFQLLVSSNDGSQARTINQLVRVGTDGKPGSPLDVLPGLYAAAIVPGGSDLNLIYPDQEGSGALSWRRLGTDGVPLTTPTTVPDVVSLYLPPAVMLGGDLVVMLPRVEYYPGPTGTLLLTRVDSTGALATPLFSIASFPKGTHSPYAVAARGTDVIAAWSSATGIHLERVSP
jgi:hypothetical protein